ncbi:helix-turn-helix domain-containing protein [Actinoplanes friuliensis]|uniref:helix-turn-helix domain-containing protein n=1 Tax=Actinoplanes friuliensis TaxID=196914 RepID=UPI0011DD6CAD|nr:helix-turn-helix transcriptional regulator [Actinoplanes friuliensis]
MGDGGTARLLREIRKRKGSTLRTAADDLGITPSHLSRLERGEKSPSAELMIKVAGYYRINPDLVALEQGRIPEDIVEILQENPFILDRLRAEFGKPEAQ